MSEFLQIPVHMDLPSVGHNLQDHIAVVGLEYFITNKIGSSEQKTKSLMSLFDYFVFGKGDFHIRLSYWRQRADVKRAVPLLSGACGG